MLFLWPNYLIILQQLPHCIKHPRTTWVYWFGFTRNQLHPTCIRVSNREPASAVGLFFLHPEIWHWLSTTSEIWKPFCNCSRYRSFFTLHNRRFAFSLDVRQSNFLFVKMGSPLSEDISTPSKKNQEINPLMVFYIWVGLVSTWRGFDIHLSIQPNKAVGWNFRDI